MACLVMYPGWIVGDSHKRMCRGAGAEPPRGRAQARPSLVGLGWIVGDSQKRIGRGAGAVPPRGRASARPVGWFWVVVRARGYVRV